MSWNSQTYRCPVHGLITGDEVSQVEIDYGELEHYCQKKLVSGKTCYKRAPYVGVRKNANSKPGPRMVSWRKVDGTLHTEPW